MTRATSKVPLLVWVIPIMVLHPLIGIVEAAMWPIVMLRECVNAMTGVTFTSDDTMWVAIGILGLVLLPIVYSSIGSVKTASQLEKLTEKMSDLSASIQQIRSVLEVVEAEILRYESETTSLDKSLKEVKNALRGESALVAKKMAEELMVIRLAYRQAVIRRDKSGQVLQALVKEYEDLIPLYRKLAFQTPAWMW